MSDLVSLRVLVVSESAADRDIWRQGATVAPVPIELLEADTAAAAAKIFARSGIDVVLLDGAFLDCSAIIRAARGARGQPFVVMISTAHMPAGGLEADGFLDRPTTAAEAQYLIDRCVRVRLPSRVLIVDDSATMRTIVRKILAASRFPLDILEVSEGLGALEQIRKGGFDIVFLDYNMPGLNGFDTLAEIKRANSGVEVVMMTSTQDETMASRARAAGATAFLKKPFYPADIDAVLHGFYGMRSERRAA
jgi:CheY-like chemotaxis protein